MTAVAQLDITDEFDPAPHRLLIDGQWREAGDGSFFAVADPATARTIAHVANATIADGLKACEAAVAAAPRWAAISPRDRGEMLRRAYDEMITCAEDLAELIVRENGKILADARSEVAYAAEFFRWYAEEAVRNRGWIGTAPGGTSRIMVLRQPIGVAVLVTPWNFPAAMATRKLGPALAAGCSVILKPASATPLTALAIGRILSNAGVPDGVVNILPSTRSDPLVTSLIGHPAVRKLSFTGSTEVGRILLAKSADRVIDCSMELGGNAPFVVFADADLDAAVAGAMSAKMRNGGEACTAANRFLVERPVLEAFGTRLAEEMRRLKVGPGLDPDSECGPLISQAARTRVTGLIDDAIAGGAILLAGGSAIDGPGWFIEPTVLSDVPLDAKILREEIFGPVAPILGFSTEQEAIDLANDTEHGLVAYVYTRDLARGLRVSEAVEAGMIGLNKGLVSDPAAPFGGMKQSGLGREGAADGLLAFLETKYIATTW